MASGSPVIVDGLVSAEKVAELLAFEAEYPELDYKRNLDPAETRDLVELAKDVGAMRVRGGYLVIGVDGRGKPTGDLDGQDLRPFDEANLVPRLLKYIAQPLELHCAAVDRGAHKVVVICVPASERGCAFFTADGQYRKEDGEQAVVFRDGDVFWRDGTRSVRLSHAGLEEIIERRTQQRVDGLREEWARVQQEIRRQEAISTTATGDAEGRTMPAPLGTVNFELPTSELTLAALNLVREDDSVALQYLLNDALSRARIVIEREDIEGELAGLLDRLTCVAATFMQFDAPGWFDRTIETLVQIYGMNVTSEDVRRFGYSTNISPDEVAPRVWLAVIERIFALGALAVRTKRWNAVRALTVQLPDIIAENGYDTNWLRHALTMSSRAHHFEEGDQKLSLLSVARADAARLDCLRADGVRSDDDILLTSLAQFDVLSNVVAIGDARSVDPRVFYTNFARFYQTRIQAIVEKLLHDREMRAALFPLGDDDLALALKEIGTQGAQEGWRFDGFHGWGGTPVGEFISQHLPPESP